MAKLGFLGLGIMGYPMARNLARAGHTVAVWSNTAAKAKQLASEEKSVTACTTPAKVAEKADCIFLCVGDGKMSEKVIVGPKGLAETAKKGTVIVDTTTVAPSESVEMTGALKKKGIEFLGAPCTGSRPGAEGGNLTFMIGGSKKIF